MSDSPEELPLRVRCGAAVLRTMLRERTTDLRRIDVEPFRDWLGGQLPAWRLDAVFVQRELVRDLRRAHPGMRALEREHRRAAAADARAPEGARLREVEVELHGVQQAVAGLAAALVSADDARRAALAEKLDAFEKRRAALAFERDRLAAASPARTTLLRLDAELRGLRRESGVDAEEARLDELVRAQGQRAGRAGGGFEETALRAIRSHVLPALVGGPLAVLTGVTLGAARTELDQVIVRGAGDAPVEVLGVVEAKRNPNDLGHGFTRRQENLAWLGGHRAAYDPARHVTRHFPTGHFDRAVHEQHGERFVFDPTSFRRFRPDERGLFMAGLYFVTRPAHLVGLSGGALARVRHRAATDERFDPDDDAYLGELLAWCGTLAEPVETPDVLGLYAEDPGLARQILLIEKDA